MFTRVLALSALLLQAGAASPFKGDGISGGGRACNGDLRIFADHLNWETSFSTCDHVPYKTLKTADKGVWVYQLTAKPKGCLFTVLRVEHSADGSGSWEVTGYPSVEAWRRRSLSNVSDCGMY